MKINKNRGRLYLVPTPLVDGQTEVLPQSNHLIVRNCSYFLVESLKMGRRHVKAMVPDFDFNKASFEELNKKTDPTQLEELLQPALAGHDLCILSDAGSPVIADPGGNIVKLAHRKGIDVLPLTGPSSIMLALMASGFNGQQFSFHGYLNRDKNKLRNDLKRLEHEVKSGYTQIFMETPYRNLAIYNQILDCLSPSSLLSIACDLTAPTGYVHTKSIAQWSQLPEPNIHKRPCIFLLGN